MSTSTAQKLKPPASFGIAFERLRDSVSKDDARSFASTTMKDVWTTAKEIETQLQRRNSLRGFRRIAPFLTGIEQYAGVIEVLCQGTPYLPFIWAPIKLLLQVAQGHITALEKLIDAYTMIGEAMPRFDKLNAAFKDNDDLQQVMGLFYSDIMEFHGRAYKFFRQRAWKMVFDSLWKTFNPRFHGILESLKKHRDLVDQEANAIDISEAKTWRSEQLNHIMQWRAERADEIDRAERERHFAQTREAVAWLDACEEHEDTLTRMLRASTTTASHWALEAKSILSWIGQSRDLPVLWLNGKPGAGKSIICSKIIEHIQKFDNILVVYYFCSHARTSRSLATEVLRNFAAQLLAANTAISPYVLETFVNNRLRPTKKNLGSIIERLISSLPSVRIVVDGLDECPQVDQDEIIEDLLRIRGPSPGQCKVFISSRDVPSISKKLPGKPTVRLDDYPEKVNQNISSYVKSRLSDLHQEFPHDLINSLGDQILSKAKGMFLWVRLVMSTLEDVSSEADVQEVIRDLPDEIEALYERILSRICGNGNTFSQRRAIRILQWMSIARRPLKRSELESAIVLDYQNPRVTTINKVRGNALSLCNPLLDVEDGPDGYVNFFHFTALEYFQQCHSYHDLLPHRAQLTVTTSCILYLTSSLDLIDPRVVNRAASETVLLCLHDLQLYANDHWFDHLVASLSAYTSSLLGIPDIQLLRNSIEQLTERHDELVSLGVLVIGEDHASVALQDSRWDPLDLSPTARNLLSKIFANQSKVSVSSGQPANQAGIYNDKKKFYPTCFETIRNAYQNIVEGLLARDQPEDTALSVFKARHGSGAFLCRHRGCVRAATGFDTDELRQKHEVGHAPQFQCTEAACVLPGLSYKTRTALTKHSAKYHGEISIPSSLTGISRRPRPTQDKSLFVLRAPRSVAQPQVSPMERVSAQEQAAISQQTKYRLAKYRLEKDSPPPSTQTYGDLDMDGNDYQLQLQLLQQQQQRQQQWNNHRLLEQRDKMKIDKVLVAGQDLADGNRSQTAQSVPSRASFPQPNNFSSVSPVGRSAAHGQSLAAGDTTTYDNGLGRKYHKKLRLESTEARLDLPSPVRLGLSRTGKVMVNSPKRMFNSHPRFEYSPGPSNETQEEWPSSQSPIFEEPWNEAEERQLSAPGILPKPTSGRSPFRDTSNFSSANAAPYHDSDDFIEGPKSIPPNETLLDYDELEIIPDFNLYPSYKNPIEWS